MTIQALEGEETSPRFTWISFYEELADKLQAYRERQGELISFLEGLRLQGCIITPMWDQDAEGGTIPLNVIDPFTFIGAFNRQIKTENRHQIAKEIKRYFNISAPLPQDFVGVPVLNNQNSWYFYYQHGRKPDDIDKLWDLFLEALKPEPFKNPQFEKAFNRVLTVKQTGENKLTMGLFWIRPNVFLSTDKKNREFLQFTKKINAQHYAEFIKAAAQRGIPFPTLSAEAEVHFQDALSVQMNDTPAKYAKSEIQYWMVGAYWDDVEPKDQTERFLTEGIWQNGYKDKYLDDVLSMQPGDKIIIKAAFTKSKDLPFDSLGNSVSCMDIKAVGTITQNAEDGRTVQVEWDKTFSPKQWYFYTSRRTLWQLRLDQHYSALLLDFIFENKPQDYAFFTQHWWSNRAPLPEALANGDESLAVEFQAYGYADALSDGVFMGDLELRELVDILKSKKNLILQGAPGVGKTFLAKKLAYLLMEAKDDSRLQLIQFHQSYSYEDFIRGFRPNKEGAFELVDGPFYRFCKRAQADPDFPYVFIIDEINRGNLSQIFGELLMLLEADKRGSDFAMALMYPKGVDEPHFYVPDNVYLLGMMNIADRSLAMVDYALRRRFAFATLEPKFGHEQFKSWLQAKQMPESLIDTIRQKMEPLNKAISEDRTLGRAFQVGHSYFCPRGQRYDQLNEAWFRRVISTEILPLLEEYWFDSPQQVSDWKSRLLEA